MANQEHRRLIGLPAEAVETWRRANPGIQIDLSGLEIKQQPFSRWDLSNANLSGATLWNCRFDQANLGDANLSQTDFSQADLTNCRLDGANAFEAKFNNAKLASASFANVDANGADFSGSILESTAFKCAKLNGAIFDNAQLNRTTFVDTNLMVARLEGANFISAELGEQTFQAANLSRARFQGMNLSHVNFTGANLEGGGLQSSNLENAILDKAILKNANISGAIIKNASLVSTSLRGVNASQAIFSGSNFRLADFYEAELSNANFDHAEGLTEAINLHTARLNTANDVRYFESIKIPTVDRLLSWERIRTVGRLPLFVASYSALILIPFLFYLLDAYNNRVELARTWAKTVVDGPEQNATYAWLAKAILDHAHHEPVPSLSFWLLVSTIMLGIGATIYSFACPPRVRSFSREEWNDQLGRSLIHYWPLAWWHRRLRMICVTCYLIGGFGVFVILAGKIYNVFVFILRNS